MALACKTMAAAPAGMPTRPTADDILAKSPPKKATARADDKGGDVKAEDAKAVVAGSVKGKAIAIAGKDGLPNRTPLVIGGAMKKPAGKGKTPAKKVLKRPRAADEEEEEEGSSTDGDYRWPAKRPASSEDAVAAAKRSTKKPVGGAKSPAKKPAVGTPDAATAGNAGSATGGDSSVGDRVNARKFAKAYRGWKDGQETMPDFVGEAYEAAKADKSGRMQARVRVIIDNFYERSESGGLVANPAAPKLITATTKKHKTVFNMHSAGHILSLGTRKTCNAIREHTHVCYVVVRCFRVQKQKQNNSENKTTQTQKQNKNKHTNKQQHTNKTKQKHKQNKHFVQFFRCCCCVFLT